MYFDVTYWLFLIDFYEWKENIYFYKFAKMGDFIEITNYYKKILGIIK